MLLPVPEDGDCLEKPIFPTRDNTGSAKANDNILHAMRGGFPNIIYEKKPLGGFSPPVAFCSKMFLELFMHLNFSMYMKITKLSL